MSSETRRLRGHPDPPGQHHRRHRHRGLHRLRRPGRQDRHHRRLQRRQVRRLPAQPRHRRLGRLPATRDLDELGARDHRRRRHLPGPDLARLLRPTPGVPCEDFPAPEEPIEWSPFFGEYSSSYDARLRRRITSPSDDDSDDGRAPRAATLRPRPLRARRRPGARPRRPTRARPAPPARAPAAGHPRRRLRSSPRRRSRSRLSQPGRRRRRRAWPAAGPRRLASVSRLLERRAPAPSPGGGRSASPRRRRPTRPRSARRARRSRSARRTRSCARHRLLHRPGEGGVADPEAGGCDQGDQRGDVAEGLRRADDGDVADRDEADRAGDEEDARPADRPS